MDSVATLDFAILEKSSDTREVATVGTEVPIDVLLLLKAGTSDNHEYFIADMVFEGQNVEAIYIPEVCDLICKVTGAKKAIVNNVVFRKKLVENQADPTFYHKAGSDFDNGQKKPWPNEKETTEANQ